MRRRNLTERREQLPVEAARAIPITEVLARYGVTARRGMRPLCPFHDDGHADSFAVSPRKNVWHCFVCGVGGDGITFVMKYKGLDFAAAVRELAAA
jgi:DNA primase